MEHPLEGMASEYVQHMSDDDLLDMDYCLLEDDNPIVDEVGAEGFYTF